MSLRLAFDADASPARNSSVTINAPHLCEANNSSTSHAHLQLAPTTLTALPDEILYLIVEHIIDDDRLSNGCIVVESVAARSLIALRRTCHTFLSLVEQALQCSLKLHVGDSSAISEDPALTALIAPGMHVRPAAEGGRTTWARGVLAVAATPELVESNEDCDVDPDRAAIRVPDFIRTQTLPIPAKLIRALIIEDPLDIDRSDNEDDNFQAHFPTVLDWLSRYFPDLVSLNLSLEVLPSTLASALPYWADTLTNLRLVVAYAWNENTDLILFPNLRVLDVSISSANPITGVKTRLPFLAPALQLLNVFSPKMHPVFVRAHLADFAPTLHELTIGLEMTAEDAAQPLALPPSFLSLRKLSAPVAVLDILSAGASAGVALPPLRSLAVYPNSFMSIHRSTVQFPLLSHVTNLELNKVLVTERVLGNLAAAAPSLVVLKLAFCHLTCDERAAPVVFPVLSELVVNSNAIDLNDLVRALRVPQIKQMNVVFHRSGAPSTLPRLWPSVSTVMLTSRHKVPLDAAVLDALPRLEILNLDTMDVDWAGGIVPELKSLTTLTTNTVCLRRLAQNPATLAGLIELNVTGILDAVPDPAFATLQRFRATTMNVRAFETLARMPKLTRVSMDRITADWAMNGLTLVYRQGNPIWRVFPQVERRSTVAAITNRLVVQVERVVDADKAVRQISSVAQSTAKYAEALPMPLDVVVAPNLDVHVVSRIGAMIEGLPAKSVAGRIVVGGDHEVLPNGQS